MSDIVAKARRLLEVAPAPWGEVVGELCADVERLTSERDAARALLEEAYERIAALGGGK